MKSRLLLKHGTVSDVYLKDDKQIHVDNRITGSGLYFILIPGDAPKFYIGQSKDIQERFSHHRTQLFNNKHYNKHLQNAFNKSKLSFFGLEEYCDSELLDEREVTLIEEQELQNPKFGYNKKPGGKGPHHHTHPEEVKTKIREAHFGSKNSTKRTVYEYDLQGNFIKEWDCAMNVVRHYGYKKSRIDQCCSQKYKSKTFMGSQWRYYKVDNIGPASLSTNSIPLRDIDQYDLDMNFIRSYANTKEIFSDLGIRASIIRASIYEGRAGAGFIWKLKSKQ